MENKTPNPKNPKQKENNRAEDIVIFFLGSGLFFVLSIKLSTSTSKTWFNPLEAPTIKNPPKINLTKTTGSWGVASLIANKYPAIAEKTTLEESRIFNNSI